MTDEQKVKVKYPDAHMCTKTITDDQYQGPTYWIEYIGMKPVRRTYGTRIQAWADAVRKLERQP